VRFEPKDFRQRRPDGTCGWTWNVKGVRPVPYRLPELIEALAGDRPVVVVEGEKDADALARWNVPATCNAGGAGKWHTALNEHFRGADVVILPDNDPAGKNHSADVAANLAGIARQVRVVELQGLPPKGDVSDWIAAGGTADEFWHLVETIPQANAHDAGNRVSGHPAEEQPKGGRGNEAADKPAAKRPARKTIELVCARDVLMRPMDWMWKGHLLRGAQQIMTGVPGLGKVWANAVWSPARRRARRGRMGRAAVSR
jgi:hypothetical protein